MAHGYRAEVREFVLDEAVKLGRQHCPSDASPRGVSQSEMARLLGVPQRQQAFGALFRHGASAATPAVAEPLAARAGFRSVDEWYAAATGTAQSVPPQDTGIRYEDLPGWNAAAELAKKHGKAWPPSIDAAGKLTYPHATPPAAVDVALVERVADYWRTTAPVEELQQAERLEESAVRDAYRPADASNHLDPASNPRPQVPGWSTPLQLHSKLQPAKPDKKRRGK
jgi:hypothetical protein